MSLTVSHSGPLPDPGTFRAYEQVCPGAADRIIRMAEQEGEHRRGIENRSVDAAIATERRTQYLAFTVFAIVAGIGGGLIAFDKAIAGYIALIGDLGVMVGGAIWNKFEDRKIRKLQELQAREAKALEDKSKQLEAPKASKRKKKSKRNRRR